MLAALFPFLSGCASPAYYSQAISGHMQLMRQREDITALLNSGETDPELARELELSAEILDFATDRLLLPDNGSYRQFVRTGRDAVTWNVVAAPEFSLKPKLWCFVVSGCVAYRGYFHSGDAERLAEKLAGTGYDTSVSPAIAYSTLGWFDDPLLDTMIQYSDEQLAAFIFHELAHQQLYVRGDTAFNEAWAGFIEQIGVRLWLESSGRSARLPGWLKQESAGIQFNALLQDVQKKLNALYASDLPEEQMRTEKVRVFGYLQDAYRQMVELQWDGQNYYSAMFSRALNNASLALVNSYRGGFCAFTQLYRSAQEDMGRFQQLAREKAELKAEQRQAWLQQSCEVIASGTDL